MKIKIDRKMRLYVLAGVAGIVSVILVVFLLAARSSFPVSDESDSNRDIAGFYRDCVDGVLKDKISQSCVSMTAIKAAYNVDGKRQLELQQGRMIMTARRIARGELTDKKAYKECIKEGACVKIPLPPAKISEKTRQSESYKKVQNLFWHLAEDGRMTRDVCANMDLCRALVKSGAYRMEK